jgi:hypothetical protein
MRPIAAIAIARTMSPAAVEKSDGGDVAHELHAEPEHDHSDGHDDERQHHGESPHRRSPEPEDQSHGHQAHGQRGPGDLVEVQHEVHGLDHLVGVLAAVACQVAELAQDDEDADAGDEADHHAVGDELGDPAELEQAERQLDQPDHQREHDEHAGALVRARLAHGVAHGEGDGARGGDGHEDGAGEQGADGRTDHERVEPVDGLHGGEDRRGHGVGDLHQAGGQTGDEVVLDVPALRQADGGLQRGSLPLRRRRSSAAER